jgi:hypothetical protein
MLSVVHLLLLLLLLLLLHIYINIIASLPSAPIPSIFDCHVAATATAAA